MTSKTVLRGSKLCARLSQLKISARYASVAAAAESKEAAWGIRAEKSKTFSIYR